MKFQTKEDKPIEARKQEAENVRTKYPDRIPVIVERIPGSQIPDVRSRKFLVPNDITMTQFIMVIRRHIQLSPSHGIFLFVNETKQGMFKSINPFEHSWTMPQSSWTMGKIYTEYKDKDGFLYVAYGSENIFGH